MGPRWKQFWVFSVGVGLGGLTIALLSAGSIYDYSDDLKVGLLPEIDAIVCPAGGRGRIRAASDLWYQYYASSAGRAKVPVLMISGAGSSAPVRSILGQMRKEVAAVLSRRMDLLLVESRSTSTTENAEEFKKVALDRNWRAVALVTSSYHMRRALGIFQAESGTRLRVLTFTHRQSPFSKSEWYRDFNGVSVTLYEFAKLLLANVRAAIAKY